MSTLLSLVAIGLALAGVDLLSSAADIAIRRNSNIWTAARPEGGGAVLMIALALLTAAVAGGWL